MKAKYPNKREMLILGLPTLLIFIGGFIFTVQEKQRIKRESGPLRLVVTNSTLETLSPKEVWQGYDLKYRLDFELQGESVIDKDLTSVLAVETKEPERSCLNILDKKGNTQRFLGVSIDDSTYIEPHVHDPLKIVTAYGKYHSALYNFILIDRDAFPSGKATLEAHAKFAGHNSKNQYIITPTANWFHVIDHDLASLNVDHTSAKLISTSLNMASPIATEYYIALVNSGPMGTKLYLNWETNGLEKQNNTINFLNSRFEDIKGQEVRVEPDEDSYAGNKFYPFTSVLNQRHDDKGISIPGQRYTAIDSDLHKVPKTYGAIFLRSNFSLNNSWPTSFRAEVRPAWLCQRPNKLNIEQVKINGNVVSALVRYTGTKTIEYEAPYSLSNGKYFSTIPENELSHDTPVPETHDRLITNWSQHLENGKQLLFFSKNLRSRRVQTPYCSVQQVIDMGGGLYQVDYAINHPNPSHMKFKAEIGIWGDGFILIEAKMP